MMKNLTKKNEKYGYFIQMTKKMMTEEKIVKHCNHVQLKTMGKFLQTSPMKNDDTVCLYSKHNKIILLCTHTVGYFIYKHHMVGLVLKVNPQLHCCYQTQSIKHTHRKISWCQRCFCYSGKKRKNAQTFTSKMAILPKVLGYSVLSMITYATIS